MVTLGFLLRRCVSIRRSLPRFDEVLPLLWIFLITMDPGHLLTQLAQYFLFQRQVFSWFLLFANWAFGRAWEGAAFLFSLFRLQLEDNCSSIYLLGCGYLLHSLVCCPASQYLRDCGRVLEQIGALMAPAAAAPIAGCPCSRAAAAPPLCYIIKGKIV